MNLAELQALAAAVGFPAADVPTAAAIAMAESSGDPYAQGDPHGPAQATPNGISTSFGLWQIHTPSWPQFDPTQLLQDPSYNARAALHIYTTRGGRFHDWSTYNDGRYLQYLPGGPPTSSYGMALAAVLAFAAGGVLAELMHPGSVRAAFARWGLAR